MLPEYRFHEKNNCSCKLIHSLIVPWSDDRLITQSSKRKRPQLSKTHYCKCQTLIAVFTECLHNISKTKSVYDWWRESKWITYRRTIQKPLLNSLLKHTIDLSSFCWEQLFLFFRLIFVITLSIQFVYSKMIYIFQTQSIAINFTKIYYF